MPDSRQIRLTTPLGDDALHLLRMTGTEELGRLFHYEADVLSESASIAIKDLLAKDATVTLDLPDGSERFFHGYVTGFRHLDRERNFECYRLTIRPFIWFLSRTADCKIFQQQTVPEIVKGIFSELGYTDVADDLTGSYRTWDYCVQYRETDLNFVCRLMEQEGIYFFFEHEEGKHTLHLSDAIDAHSPAEGFDEIPFTPPSDTSGREEGHIHAWRTRSQVQPGEYVLSDYDFENSTANLEVQSSVPRPHAQADHQIYDYPGEYLTTGEGDWYAAARINELHALQHVVEGQTNARGIAAGSLFTLDGHPRTAENIEYLVTKTTIALRNPHGETRESEDAGATFAAGFTAIPSAQRFVPSRTTPKPAVQGPQTAIVSGAAGEEIYTDQHARVKVQFHWDRYGKSDENSSCWLRVSQAWAGKEWGAIHIPRIGHEVVVEFLEGDPDRPIVTGRVYHKDNKPPYGLDANKTQSGILSRSSKEGATANFNELRFEDLTGSEQVYLHAEKDFDTVVENDQTLHVMNDRTTTVDVDETDHIKGQRTEDVGVDETITIKGTRTEEVGGNETLTVSGNRKESITGNEDRTVGAAMTETVLGNFDETIKTKLSETVTGGIIMFTPATLKVKATGGLKKTMAGGFTTIDAFFDSTGQKNNDIYGMKVEIVGMSTSIIALMNQCAFNTKIEATNTAVEAKGAFNEQHGMEFETVGAAIKQLGADLQSNTTEVDA